MGHSDRRAFEYDASGIPAVYDRARDHGPELLELWMNVVESATRGSGRIGVILDLGCGTGRFSGALSDRFDASVLGLDASAGMLERARAKAGPARVRFARGRGEEIPLAGGVVDLIFVSMVFHHLRDPRRVAAECRRVLRGDGVVFVRTATIERIPDYPYVPFIPESLPLLHEILPACGAVRDAFESAGLRTVEQDLIVQQIAGTHAEYAAKLAAGGDSVLARLRAADFEAGLSRVRAHAARVDPLPVTEPIDVFAFAW